MLSWVMIHGIKCRELALFHFRGSLENPSVLLICCIILGLTKNLISVSTLEDKGYQVKFRDHRVYIRPKGSDRSLDRVIGRRSGKVYKLHFEPTKALVISSNISQGCIVA